MKKNRIILIALILLLIISAVSVGLNIKNVAEKDSFRRLLINNAFSGALEISRDLDSLIIALENKAEVDKETQNSLIIISQKFVRLDTVLKQYAISFPPKGTIRGSYTGIPDFGYISNSLLAGSDSADSSMPYNGILVDDAISENEIRYLEILRDDFKLIAGTMSATDNPLQANGDLTVSQMDNILKTFFDKWSFNNEECPYLLLRRE